MKNVFRYWPLFIIVIVAFVFRTYSISSNPPSLSWDEVSIGYNAYSILKTGKDEHGRFLPLDTFIAYGDYKPPLAIYLTVPSIALFGLDEFAVRIPSAVAGTVTVFLTYYLVSGLIGYASSPLGRGLTGLRVIGFAGLKKNKTSVNFEYFKTYLPIVSTALLAISPWHINISRAGFEANIALMFLVFGIYLVLRAIESPKYWYYAWLPFVAAIYTFNSARYFAPMFGLVLLVIFRDAIWANRKKFIIGVCIAVFFMIPIIPHIVSKEARLRFAEVNIFSDISIVETSNRRIAEDGNTWLAKIVHNRRVGYTIEYLRHFADNFQPWFFFIKGDGNPKFSIQEVGQMYLIEAPFLFIGLFSMFAIIPRIAVFLLLWIIIAIIPAATARETPHALRILDTLPTWQIFTGFGILTIVDKAKSIPTNRFIKQAVFYLVIFMLASLYLFSVGYYLHQYYVHYPKAYSNEWQYGYREAIRYAQSVENKYDVIYISETIGRPYMYTLFYTRFDPDEFIRIKDSSFDDAGFYHVFGFGKYRFIRSMPTDRVSGKSLYLVDPSWTPAGVPILKTISTLEGIRVVSIFEK